MKIIDSKPVVLKELFAQKSSVFIHVETLNVYQFKHGNFTGSQIHDLIHEPHQSTYFSVRGNAFQVT